MGCLLPGPEKASFRLNTTQVVWHLLITRCCSVGRRPAPFADPSLNSRGVYRRFTTSASGTKMARSPRVYTSVAAEDLGSKASRRPSPMKLNASRVITRIAQGKPISHQ